MKPPMNTGKSKMEFLPDEIKSSIHDWLGSETAEVLQAWESDGTWYCVCLLEGVVYCLRLFTIGGQWKLSQDSVHEIA